jgi:hypothetical protein
LISFDVHPLQGSVIAGGKLDLKVVFSPDHPSEYYADIMRINLSAENHSKAIQLFGRSRKNNIYIRGVEFLTNNMNTESILLTEVDQSSEAAGEGTPNTEKEKKEDKANKTDNKVEPKSDLQTPIPILVVLNSISSSKSVGEYSQAEKIIQIGCMKSNLATDKKDVRKVIK